MCLLQFVVDASVVWSRKLALTLFTLFELTRWWLNKKRRILKKTRRRKPPIKMLSWKPEAKTHTPSGLNSRQTWRRRRRCFRDCMLKLFDIHGEKKTDGGTSFICLCHSTRFNVLTDHWFVPEQWELFIFYWWKKNCGQTTLNVFLMFLEISCEYCMYGVVLEGLPWLWRAFNSVTEVRTGSGVVVAYPQTWSSTYQNE